MKIAQAPLIAYPQVVREKRDGDSSRSGQEQREQKQKSENQEDSSEFAENMDQRLKDAVSGFDTDQQAHALGLKASVEGRGPGLKVMLKDSQGTVVRSLTGEEFLKLRHAVARGKILDQKL